MFGLSRLNYQILISIVFYENKFKDITSTSSSLSQNSVDWNYICGKSNSTCIPLIKASRLEIHD
jgi:hypothetical protein